MKRLAIVSLILTILVGADGIFMMITHYQPKDVNNFDLSDGGTVLIAAVFLLITTIIAFLAASRSSRSEERSQDV